MSSGPRWPGDLHTSVLCSRSSCIVSRTQFIRTIVDWIYAFRPSVSPCYSLYAWGNMNADRPKSCLPLQNLPSLPAYNTTEHFPDHCGNVEDIVNSPSVHCTAPHCTSPPPPSPILPISRCCYPRRGWGWWFPDTERTPSWARGTLLYRGSGPLNAPWGSR